MTSLTCLVAGFSFRLSGAQTLTKIVLGTSALCLIVFLSESTLVFLVSFELSSLPMFGVVSCYGSQPEALQASVYLGGFSLIRGFTLLSMFSSLKGLEFG